MKGIRALAALALLGCAGSAAGDDVQVCYNYGCAVQAVVHVRGAQLLQVRMLFARQKDAAGERQAIARAIGLFETYAGKQTPTHNDKGGNLADEGVNGRMDCIDHSRNTTAYLRLMARRGWLKFHTVLDPVKRAPLLVNEHWAAQIREKQSGEDFVVDSWFFDNGHPAAIFPLEDWKSGAEPHE